MERFESSLGGRIDPSYLCSLSDEELAKEIRDRAEWNADLLRDLVWRADSAENRLGDRWDEDDENFEALAKEAAQVLGVDIGI